MKDTTILMICMLIVVLPGWLLDMPRDWPHAVVVGFAAFGGSLYGHWTK